LLDRLGEQALTEEDVGILGEEAEDQPRHEVVHVRRRSAFAQSGLSLSSST
jgi:hypothetical protein